MSAQAFEKLLDEQHDRLLQQIQAERRERRADLDREGMLWVALAPAWTVPLARAAGLPSGGMAPEDLLERLVKEGLCEVSRARSGPQGEIHPVYTMRETGRQEILTAALDDCGLKAVRATLAEAGKAVLGAGASLTPPLRRWAELAAAATGWEHASWHLETRVGDALAEGSIAEANRWIEAAHGLVELADGHLDVATLLAGNRVALAHRRQENERHAPEFLERPGQIAAFRALLASRETWALHFIGLGGMGKTMLARHLAGRLIPDEGGSVARIDFDYLNPSYPTRAPDLLLSTLAAELRLYDRSGQASSVFARFDDRALDWHELVQATIPGSPEERDAATGQLRDAAIGLFAQALELLPRPVVLVLDTCEELAKVDGGQSRNVLAMLDMLEALHERFEPLRVVLFGRRPLPARPYLSSYRIEPFNRFEAEAYLTRLQVRPELFNAIIERSATRDPVKSGLRVSPFELALYARWALDDPDVTPEQIQSLQTDRYVELRIMGRLRDDRLRGLVPLVARIDRLDRRTIEAATGSADGTALLGELERQEWICRKGEFLTVEPAIADRMRHYFEMHPAPGLALTLRRAADHLHAWTLQQPLLSLDVVGHFDALVRLLDGERERLVGWWRQVEARIARDGEYSWALRLTGHLLGEDGAIGARRSLGAMAHPLEAAVLATHAGARLHAGEAADLAAIWRRVVALTGGRTEAEARWLRLRAQAGIVTCDVLGAADAPGTVRLAGQRLGGLVDDPVRDEQAAGALVGALEAVVEADEVGGASHELPPALGERLFTALADGGCSSALRAFAAALTARIHLHAGGCIAAKRWFARARELLGEAGPDTQRWLHWRAPQRLDARVRLEQVRAAFPGTQLPAQVLKARALDPLEVIDSIDGDRLMALRLQLVESMTGSRGAIEAELRQLGERRPNADAWLSWPATCQAHRVVPPLQIAQSLALARLGLVGLGIDRLRAVTTRTRSSAAGLPYGIWAEHALLGVYRRMRLRDEGYGLTVELTGTAGDLAWIGPLEALDGPKWAGVRQPPAAGDLGGWHDWWRTRWHPTIADREALFRWASHARDLLARTSFEALSCRLDLDEAALLDETPATAWPGAAGWWLEAVGRRPEHALRLHLRALALGRRLPAKLDESPAPLMQLTGMRRAAALALDEGELLALTLADRAVPLLTQAAEWYRRSGDAAGATIAGACAALWRARLGSRPDLDELRDDFERLRVEVVPTLPAWDELEAAVGTDPASLLDGLAVLEWRPWVLRLLLALASSAPSRSPEGWERLCAWMDAHYASDVEGQCMLPAELEGWPGWMRSGLAVSHFLTGARPVPLPLVAGPAAQRVVRIRRLDDADPIRALRSPMHVALEVDRRPAELRLPGPGVDQVRLGARSLAASLGPDRLDELLAAPRDVTLSLSLPVASAPWEQLFLQAARQLGNAAPAARLRRTLARVKQRPPKPWDRCCFVASVVGRAKDRELLDRAFMGLPDHWALRACEGLDRLPSRWDANLLHLVVEGVPTGQGLAARTARSRTLETAVSKSGERGGVATAADLTHVFPALDLCILQGPARAPSPPTAADAEQAAYLRHLGAELLLTGVPAVVVLPAARQAERIAALARLARTLSEASTVPAQALVDAVHALLLDGIDGCVYTSSSALREVT